jgi:hypothetical protein
MSRVFAYARVSTVEQFTENQRELIAAAGYSVDARRYVEEKVTDTRRCIRGARAWRHHARCLWNTSGLPWVISSNRRKPSRMG